MFIFEKFVRIPSVKVTLDRSTVDMLMALSKNHQDHSMRLLSVQGGMLYGWNNALSFQNTYSPVLTFQEIDCVAKLCEQQGFNFSESQMELRLACSDILKKLQDEFARLSN